MTLVRLIYVSAAIEPFTPEGLRELLVKARSHNSCAMVTGLLLYHKKSFFQILEGEDEIVGPLFLKIERDPRHGRVLMLSRLEVEGRNFGHWSMGFVDLDHRAGKLPGFTKLLEANSSFLDLEGDSDLVKKLVDGFQEGGWRQSVE